MPDLKTALGSIVGAELATATESFHFWTGPGGLSYLGALGGLSMEQGESSFDPQARGDKVRGVPTAFGPFQHHMARILAMAAPPPKGAGIDIRTAPHIKQLEATAWEITKGSYARVGKLLSAVTTLEESVAVWVHDFEQSADQARDIARRLVFAEHWRSVFPQVK